MTLIRWSPNWDPFADMEQVMNRLPSVVPHGGHALATFVPAVDLYETKEALVVETHLAGMHPQDVHVSVEHGVLTISGESKKEREVEEKNYYRKETRSGSFHRQVPLPVPIKEESIVAEFEEGILKITCPKANSSDPKTIPVQIKK